MACPLLSMSTIYLKKKSMPSKRISRKSIVAGLLGGILVFFLFWLAGCASIVKGGTQKIRITSEPADAVVRIINDSNMEVWNSQTPATVALKRGSGYFSGASYRVEITKEGWEKQTITISSGMNGWYLAGNILLGGLIGWIIVDPITGGMWTLSPEEISLNLKVKAAQVLPSGEGLHVVLLERVGTELFNKHSPKEVVN